MGADEPLARGVEGEVAGSLAAARGTLEQGQRAIRCRDAEDDERIFATVGGVEEFAILRNGDFGGCVPGDWEVGRDGLDVEAGVYQKALGRGGGPGGGP